MSAERCSKWEIFILLQRKARITDWALLGRHTEQGARGGEFSSPSLFRLLQPDNNEMQQTFIFFALIFKFFPDNSPPYCLYLRHITATTITFTHHCFVYLRVIISSVTTKDLEVDYALITQKREMKHCIWKNGHTKEFKKGGEN